MYAWTINTEFTEALWYGILCHLFFQIYYLCILRKLSKICSWLCDVILMDYLNYQPTNLDSILFCVLVDTLICYYAEFYNMSLLLFSLLLFFPLNNYFTSFSFKWINVMHSKHWRAPTLSPLEGFLHLSITSFIAMCVLSVLFLNVKTNKTKHMDTWLKLGKCIFHFMGSWITNKWSVYRSVHWCLE